eukprot:gene2070-2390_t
MAEERWRGRPESLLERAQQLRAKLHEDSYDVPAYKQLLDELRSAPMSEEARKVYEELVTAFPTANNEPRGAEGILETKQAYEFTLDTIGQDIHSGPLWQEYISFLSAPKPGTPGYAALWSTGMVGGQEESTKTASLSARLLVRRHADLQVFGVAIAAVLIWKNYEAFENQTALAAASAAAAGGGGSSAAAAAKQFGSRVINEQRPRFQAARMAYRERKRKMEGIDTAALPVPPGKGGSVQQEQVKLWKGFLEYERSNPQRLEAAALTQRVELAYMQALMCLLHFPEVWYDYARWHADSGGGVAAAAACLLRAVAALPDCLLLHFALADLEEAQGNIQAAKDVYESLVKQLERVPGPQPNGVAAAAAAAAAPPPQPAGGPITALPPDQAALVWIQYMRFSRRSESVTASRRVYVASALMEWRHARERDVARKIFEKGLEVAEFATTPEYILAYADFLCDVGDVDNARALFERTLTEDANRKSVLLWERYLSFEFEMGDLQSALRLEKRAREALGELGGAAGASAARNIQLLLLRYQFLDSWACPPGQKQYLMYLMGKGPAPPGFERQRARGAGAGLGGSDAGDDRSVGVNGGKGSMGGDDLAGDRSHWRGGSSEAWKDGAAGDGQGSMPPPLERFIMSLPPDNYLDGPLPDLNLVVDSLYSIDEDGGGDGIGEARGIKREFEDEEVGTLGAGPGRDIYRLRAKQRARAMTAVGEG